MAKSVGWGKDIGPPDQQRRVVFLSCPPRSGLVQFRMVSPELRRNSGVPGTDSSGHIRQGRFKAFPVQEDDHLRVVLRYIERNPLGAALVERAEDWAGLAFTVQCLGMQP